MAILWNVYPVLNVDKFVAFETAVKAGVATHSVATRFPYVGLVFHNAIHA